MSTRSIVLGVTVAASLAGCVERGDWKPAAQLQPQALGAQQTLAGAKLDAAAWPADQWWRAYADPQLDTLIAEALAGSPSLEIAAARLRLAQAQAIAAGAVRVPAASLDAETTRQRYPEHGLFPPPFAGSYSTDASAGALALAESIWVDLLRFRLAAWALVLAPYGLVQLLRVTLRLWRPAPL